MERKVLSEIYRIREMMGFVNEQNRGELVGQRKGTPYKETKEDKPYSWNGRDKGVLNFSVLGSKYPLSTNVGPEGFTIREHQSIPSVKKDSTGSSTEPTDEVILDTLILQGSDLPYADNMVKPYFDKYPDAFDKFTGIVKLFTRYIKNGGGNKLTNVTIQGSADSGKPTLKVPEGYGSLDHPDSQPYGGEKDPFKMNQYLADNRANEYAKVLIEKIKEATGFDLKIKVLPGINYYGQTGKRGEKFRTITLTPNAEALKVPRPNDKGEKPTDTSNIGELPKNKGVEIIIHTDGGNQQTIRGYSIVEKNGTNLLTIPYELSKELNVPKFVGQIKSSIQRKESSILGGNFYVDNKLIGEIQSKERTHPEFQTMGLNWSYWSGPITTLDTTANNTEKIITREVDGQNIEMVILQDSYFVFYTKDFTPNNR